MALFDFLKQLNGQQQASDPWSNATPPFVPTQSGMPQGVNAMSNPELWKFLGRFGAGMAAASGPSDKPVSFGQAMAGGFDNADKQSQKDALLGIRANGAGKSPASVQIVDEMQKAAQIAQDPRATPQQRAMAKYRFDALNQVSKSFSIDRGMTPGMPDLGFDQPMPQNGQTAQQSPQDEFTDALNGLAAGGNLSPATGEIPFGGVPIPRLQSNPAAIPGYAGAAGGIEATKKRMEQDAKNASDLSFAKPTAEEAAIGKASGEAKGSYVKKGLQADDNALVIDNILKKDETGRDVLDKATGSGFGAATAAGKGFFGVSDESTQANAQLAIYGGQLLNNVPRMEGPQSDADMKSYKDQAGKIADPKIPAPDKRAALEAIQQLKAKYETLNSGAAAFDGVKPTQPPRIPGMIPKNAPTKSGAKNWVIKNGKLVPQ